MTSFLAERRSPAVHRVALLAVGALVATGLITGLDRTTAAFGDDDGVSTAVTTRPACVPDPEDPSAYASGMLDADNPLLRWTFTDGLLPEATILPTDPNAPVPKATGVGLLVCDPAELAGVGARGSLSLTQAGADSGLTATTPVLGSSFTLLFWTSADRGAAGELASLRSGSGDLVLSLSETQRVQRIAGRRRSPPRRGHVRGRHRQPHRGWRVGGRWCDDLGALARCGHAHDRRTHEVDQRGRAHR